MVQTCKCPLPTPDVTLGAREYQIDMLCRGHPNGGESCIVVESRLTRSLVAKPPQRSLLVVREFRSASEEHYEYWCVAACKTHVGAPKAHQNELFT